MRSNEELENANAVLQELTDHYDHLKEREQNRLGVRCVENHYHARCPRCQARTKMLSGQPYCPDCYWDSLEDPSYSKAA